MDGVEAAAVARARELRQEGNSLREIAKALDAEGHRPRGTRWHVQTLSRIVAVNCERLSRATIIRHDGPASA